MDSTRLCAFTSARLVKRPRRFRPIMKQDFTVAAAGRSPDASHARFAFFHPQAKRVCLAGSFNDWNPTATPMAPAGRGWWLRELWLPPGQYEYLLVVDGQWMVDPQAKSTSLRIKMDNSGEANSGNEI